MKTIEEIYEKYKDNGDERFGLAKHNNTVLQNILDDVSPLLKDAFQAGRIFGIEECEKEVREQIEKQLAGEYTYSQNVYNDAVLSRMRELKKVREE